MRGNKIGQVWIETVLYTLIALALISLVLAFMMPKINQAKDKLVVEQTLNLIMALNDKITITADSTGNLRIFYFSVKKGELNVYPDSDKIVFLLEDMSKPYSEPGVEIRNGPIAVLSQKDRKNYNVSLTLDYSSKYNLTYNGKEESKRFGQSATHYKLNILNNGSNPKIMIDLSSG